MKRPASALASLAAASAVVLAVGSARAQEAPFGRRGELAVSWDQPLVAGSVAATDPVNPVDGNVRPAPMALTPIGFQYYSLGNDGGSGTVFTIAPALDYFVVDNLSLGGQVMVGLLDYSPPQGQGSTTTIALYGIAPQIGYDFSLTDSVSFWPKVFFAFAGAIDRESSGTVGIFAPFLFHIATHFYFGVGPDFSTEVFVNENGFGHGASKITTLGAMATVGGWFFP